MGSPAAAAAAPDDGPDDDDDGDDDKVTEPPGPRSGVGVGWVPPNLPCTQHCAAGELDW